METATKKPYEFWLVIAGNPPFWELKIASKSMDIRFWAQCDVLGAPIPPGSCKRGENFENVQNKFQKEHNFQFLRGLYDHTYELTII